MSSYWTYVCVTDPVTRNKIHLVIPLCALRTAAEINDVFRDTQFHNLIASKMEKKEAVGFTTPFDKTLHLLKSIFIKIVWYIPICGC